MKKTFSPTYIKKYSDGYSKGLNPFQELNSNIRNEAYIAGFNSGRADYQRMNGYISDGIPQRIVTNKVLEDFLVSGLLGLSVDTIGYTSYQIEIISKWYQSGTEKYDPNQSVYLFELLEQNGIQIN